MFEITSSDVALLNDADLRTLIGRLCEAEVRAQGNSVSSVTWGGNQNAPDGGLDVRVSLPTGTAVAGYIPRAATGFQVKKPDMPRTEIVAEMQPDGVVRPSIHELAKQNGAYIIVSGAASTSDAMLQRRVSAMTDVAVKAGISHLHVDFYDGSRVATWLRSRIGLIPWVRQQVGRAIQGWQSYGAWAYPPEGLGPEYFADTAIRVCSGRENEGEGDTVLDGLNRIRKILRSPKGVVRLVGLSGVGKTRFVQALFDERVGVNSLDPAVAVYANMGDGPDPQPVPLLSNLSAAGERAIVVIDNCAPELHRRLAELVRSPTSNLNLVTIEYDIREDQPEGTDVFALEPSSNDLIEKLVRFRYPLVSQVDAGTIAKFSGGNARIAIALSETIAANGSVAGLTDAQVFERLFHQRHAPNEVLLQSAQVCSLVYSFQGEEVYPGSELAALASLSGQTVQQLFQSTAELSRRDLLQHRGPWRAVLPHAVANRLAALALANIPRAVVLGHLVDGGSERLLKSFCRRLGYLHGIPEAEAIVGDWLATGGMLGDVARLNSLGKEAFLNVAPVLPRSALNALVRASTTKEGLSRLADSSYVRLLRLLAYDADNFEKCCDLLLALATVEGDSHLKKEAGEQFSSLFTIYLSGTQATVQQRTAYLDKILSTGATEATGCALKALANLLEAWHFSGQDFAFGARPRDFGYRPTSAVEVRAWYSSALALAKGYCFGFGDVSLQVRKAIADKFRGIWSRANAFDELEALFRFIAQKEFWPSGWIAVRMTRQFDAEKLPAEVVDRLIGLEKALQATSLTDQVRLFVLSRLRGNVVLEDITTGTENFSAAMAAADARAMDLGREVSRDWNAFSALAPELVERQEGGRLWQFGKGLAANAEARESHWKLLTSQFAAKPENDRDPQALLGFLAEANVSSPELVQALLDSLSANDEFSLWMPQFETVVPIAERGLKRLLAALAGSRVPVLAYRALAYCRSPNELADRDFGVLVSKILEKSGGFPVAMEIVSMRLHGLNPPFDKLLVEAGRNVLLQIVFERSDSMLDYNAGRIAAACFVGDEGASSAAEVAQRVMMSISAHETSGYQHQQLLQGLLEVQPKATLDALTDERWRKGRLVSSVIEENLDYGRSPFDVLKADIVISWCNESPQKHYPFIAPLITIAKKKEDSEELEWTSLAQLVLANAPDKSSIAKIYLDALFPMSWSGSRAEVMQRNLTLFEDMERHSDSSVSAFAKAEKLRYIEKINTERQNEVARDRVRDERFE